MLNILFNDEEDSCGISTDEERDLDRKLGNKSELFKLAINKLSSTSLRKGNTIEQTVLKCEQIFHRLPFYL